MMSFSFYLEYNYRIEEIYEIGICNGRRERLQIAYFSLHSISYSIASQKLMLEKKGKRKWALTLTWMRTWIWIYGAQLYGMIYLLPIGFKESGFTDMHSLVGFMIHVGTTFKHNPMYKRSRYQLAISLRYSTNSAIHKSPLGQGINTNKDGPYQLKYHQIVCLTFSYIVVH